MIALDVGRVIANVAIGTALYAVAYWHAGWVHRTFNNRARRVADPAGAWLCVLHYAQAVHDHADQMGEPGATPCVELAGQIVHVAREQLDAWWDGRVVRGQYE